PGQARRRTEGQLREVREIGGDQNLLQRRFHASLLCFANRNANNVTRRRDFPQSRTTYLLMFSWIYQAAKPEPPGHGRRYNVSRALPETPPRRIPRKDRRPLGGDPGP